MVMKIALKGKLAAILVALLCCFGQVSAQNKNIDKGKETLTKAMEQKDAAKKQDMINKAKEDFQKGGMKPQESAVLVGDAYLEKGDLANAVNAYGTANKEDKAAGYRKVAEAYVETAFSGDAKTEAKALSNAMKYFDKAGAHKEGARMIGDRYFEKGAESYPKALDYYLAGDASSKVEQIAKDFFEKGGEGEVKAAETFLKLKSTEGYKKAGDIYFDRKEYQKASDAYLAGNVAEGIKKYANYLYSQNRNEEADNFYVKLAEIYADKKDDELLEKLATECQGKGSYRLASRIYDKAGNTTQSDKSLGIDKLIAFDLDSAKMLFTGINDAAMVKVITDNTKALTPLKDLADNFDEIMRGAPTANLIVDSISGKSVMSASDQKLHEDYYKSVRDQIVKNVFDVSTNYAKLTNPDLKKYARIRFLKYGAIRNILDTDTFAPKKQKADIKVKDVIL
jgi:hypothetical protein